MSKHSPVLRFDDFELDVDSCELRRRGKRISIAPQPFRLLSLLAVSGGRVIDRETIRKELWDSTFVDFEHGVNFCVSEIRRALGDRAARPKYIETLPKRGYRFMASVIVKDRNGVALPLADERVELANRLAEGRRLLREMGLATLDLAKKNFEEALRLDPNCAMAHCGLGGSLAMRFISRSTLGDLELAKIHLERAAELDPELAEPYPWLGYVYFRYGDIEKALESGLRGVRLLPDLVYAQYFLGAIRFSTCEIGEQNYQVALNHLLLAVGLEPRWLASWFFLSSICLLNGEYNSAERFALRLCHFEGATGPVLRFPGAENLMGLICLHRGEAGQSRDWFNQSLAKLSALDHTYAEGMRAWCASGLGDLELREGNAAAALAHYRLAWQIVNESPAMMAQERHAVRALAGMAAAYAAMGKEGRARDLLTQAEQRLPTSSRLQICSPAAALGELHHAFTVAYVRVRELDQALFHLRKAFRAGWHDRSWLLRDTEMLPLHAEPAFWSLIEEIQTTAKPLRLNDSNLSTSN